MLDNSYLPCTNLPILMQHWTVVGGTSKYLHLKIIENNWILKKDFHSTLFIGQTQKQKEVPNNYSEKVKDNIDSVCHKLYSLQNIMIYLQWPQSLCHTVVGIQSRYTIS